MSLHPLITDLLARLAPLGPTIPILRPEDVELPISGGKPGQQGGLRRYVLDHPEGYVQLNYPSGMLSNAYLDVSMMQLETVAASAQLAEALSRRVRDLIGSLPVRPTPYTVFIPPQTLVTPDAGFARVVTTYQTRAFL